VQSCPNARTALKFFTEDGRFDVIATGSLLGIRYKEESSLPVGYVDRLEMHSLDFEEYLWARGYTTEAVEMLASYVGQTDPVPEAVHETMMGLFREHIVVGGMPKAVQTFVDTHNFAEVLRVQRGILEDYRDDIAKYAEGVEKAKARACFDSIPRQLARDYKKFSYAVVEHNAGARKYAGSLQWLYDAGVINFCHNLEAISLPLEGSAIDNNFKVYLRDTGLLVAMLEDGSQADIFNGNLGIYKGAVYENIVGDVFAKQGRRLYFYGEGAHFEIDFVIRQGGAAVPVEVKSSQNRRAKSLKSILDRGLADRAIKLSPANRGTSGAIDTYPLYLAPFIQPDGAHVAYG
jgi:predicted AAA+ superfamily ATPase